LLNFQNNGFLADFALLLVILSVAKNLYGVNYFTDSSLRSE